MKSRSTWKKKTSFRVCLTLTGSSRVLRSRLFPKIRIKGRETLIIRRRRKRAKRTERKSRSRYLSTWALNHSGVQSNRQMKKKSNRPRVRLKLQWTSRWTPRQASSFQMTKGQSEQGNPRLSNEWATSVARVRLKMNRHSREFQCYRSSTW